jgi:uncharacterized membrane protein YebE (DUF533 family)
MEIEEFEKILLNIAVCAISCDGHIDDLEIKELHLINKKSPYFSQTNLTSSLNNSIAIAMDSYFTFENSVFNELNKYRLSVPQELTILEISMALIAADNEIDKSEVKFINLLRRNLSIDDLTISERFGKINYLDLNNTTKDEFTKLSDTEL